MWCGSGLSHSTKLKLVIWGIYGDVLAHPFNFRRHLGCFDDHADRLQLNQRLHLARRWFRKALSHSMAPGRWARPDLLTHPSSNRALARLIAVPLKLL